VRRRKAPYGLTASSKEERTARDYIVKNRPDVVILVANAAALDRNLYLLAEILALPLSVALVLAWYAPDSSCQMQEYA
jgi:ferrous iron transport protein B